MLAPTFCVVIPLYNHAGYVASAIESVLNQTHPVDEIVVVDDGSTDNSFQVASSVLSNYPCAVVRRQVNAGAHAALNRAISMGRASHVAVLNSDDLFEPEKIARCLDILRSTQEPDLICGRVNLIDRSGELAQDGVAFDWLHRAEQFFRRSGHMALALLNENFVVSTSNMVFSRAVWKRVGGFQPLRYCHDLDFLMMSAAHGRLHYDGEATHIRYRLHAGNTIKENIQKVQLEIAAVLAVTIKEHGLGLIGGDMTIEGLATFWTVLKNKELSDLALMLGTLLSSSENRTEFYERVAGRDNQTILDAVATRWKAELPDALVAPALAQKVAVKQSSRLDGLAVAIELSSFDKGGLQKVVLDSALEMSRRGIRPIIITVGPLGELARAAVQRDIEVVALPNVNADVFYATLLKARNVRVSMSHFSRMGYKIFEELKIPNVTFIHNVYAMLGGQVLADFKADDQYVARYVSVSKAATRYAIRRLGCNADKISTIANGLIIEEHRERAARALPASRHRLGIGTDDYVFLNVASYNLHKAHYLMAEAMRIILRKRCDIRIVCVGNEVYPPHVRELRDHLGAVGLREHMIMPGYFSDVAPYYLMSDAFLLPSFIEGWSIAMNEAMFYGKPMILSSTGGAAEVIDNNDIGLLIENEYGDVCNLDSYILDKLAYKPQPYHTAGALADAMIQFADRRDYWKEAGLRGKEKIWTKYDFSSCVDEYMAIIQDLM